MSDPGNDFEVYQPTTMTSSLPNGMKKTINLGSDDLKKLNLKYGENEVCFWVTTMYQGRFSHASFNYVPTGILVVRTQSTVRIRCLSICDIKARVG